MYQRHNIPQKQLYTAALKQPLSPCKGYQKLQLSQAGQAHSLSCKGERSTWGEGSTQKSPLCQEPYERGGDMDISQSSCWQGVLGKEWRGLEAWITFWGTFRTMCCQENLALWHGLRTRSTRTFFWTHHQTVALSPKYLCSRERASPSLYSWGM